MSPDDFIEKAIECGARDGLYSLGPVEQVIFAVSEAEVYCDMEGIDGLLDRYRNEAMEMFVSAFSSIGAVEIAETLKAITSPGASGREEMLARANELITVRRQYSYESIRAFVERKI